MGKPLRLYVYSSIMDVVREVRKYIMVILKKADGFLNSTPNHYQKNIQVLLLPSNAWGGTGSIGCDIGYGYLHKIPLHSSEEEEEEGVEGEGHNHSDHQHPHPHHHQVNPIDTSINSAANTVASASDDVQRKLFDDNVSPDEAVLDSEVLALADPMIEEEEDDDGGSFAIGAVKHELGVDGLTEEETRGDENQHDHYRDQHHRHQHNQQEKSSNKLPLPLTAPPPIDTLQELDQLAHKLESLENVPITSNNKNNHHSLLQQQQQIPLVPDGLFKSPSQPPMNESVFY